MSLSFSFFFFLSFSFSLRLSSLSHSKKKTSLTANVTSASQTLFDGGHTLHLIQGCPTPEAANDATSTTIQNASCGRCVRGPATATQRSLEGEDEWPTKARPPRGQRRIPVSFCRRRRRRKEVSFFSPPLSSDDLEGKKKKKDKTTQLTVDPRADGAGREAVAQLVDQDREHQDGPVGEEGPEEVLFFFVGESNRKGKEKVSFFGEPHSLREKTQRKGRRRFVLSSLLPSIFRYLPRAVDLPDHAQGHDEEDEHFFLVLEVLREGEKEKRKVVSSSCLPSR